MTDHSAAHGEQHHPGWQLYTTIAVILFVLTALEVGAYEVAERNLASGFGQFIHGMVVEILLVLSAAKFALVAMFYMHLKFDHRLYSWVFVVPMCFATAVILAFLALFAASHRS